MYGRNGQYKKFIGSVNKSIRNVTKGSVPPSPKPPAIINTISQPTSSAIQFIAVQQPQPVVEDIIQPQPVKQIDTSTQTNETQNTVEGSIGNNNNAVDAIEEINNVNAAAVNVSVPLPAQVENVTEINVNSEQKEIESVAEVNVNSEQKEIEGQVSDEKFDNDDDWVELQPGLEGLELSDEGVQAKNNSFVSLSAQVIQNHFVLGRNAVRGQEPQLDNTSEQNTGIIRNNQI